MMSFFGATQQKKGQKKATTADKDRAWVAFGGSYRRELREANDLPMSSNQS
jgi:hypothetical protein